MTNALPPALTPALTPAMTPEEWKAARRYPPGVVYGFEDGAEEGVMSRHRMAAMCLYNQPFGFTREDVALLRKRAQSLYSESVNGYPDSAYLGRLKAEGEVYDSLANRIASLLPPE